MMTFKWWKIIKVKKKVFYEKIFHLITNERENKRNFFFIVIVDVGKKNSQKPMFRCCLKNKNFFPLIFENHTCWIEQKYSFFACLRKKKMRKLFFLPCDIYFILFFHVTLSNPNIRLFFGWMKNDLSMRENSISGNV
jgi:hypothetical protein